MMKKDLIKKYGGVAILMVIAIILLLVISFACDYPERETGELIKVGKVVDIKYDVIFGACFTDWRNEIYFDDGTVLWTDSQDDLGCIVYNLTGEFHFEKNYFVYEDAWYKFNDFLYVEYIE